jgi:peptide/nickel transport system ATP-binding protein
MTIEVAHDTSLLSIRDLRVDGEIDGIAHPIIRSVSLDLDRGEVLGLIGESGAGKSTIGLAAIGILRPGCRVSGGSIVFDGVDLVTAPETTLRKLRGSRIAYVAQSASASFNPAHRLIDQTIESVLIHGIETRAAAIRRAVDLYSQLQLPDPAHFGARYPHQVSGGQLQRAIIAMAMMSNPDMIIFDEPTTALDVTTQIEVLVAIRSLVAQRHLAAIYVTHDLALVAQIADRIMVLKNGEMVEQAPTRTMLSAPTEDYTKSLWAVRNLSKASAVASVPILQISDVSAFYGDYQVLQDINLDIGKGRTVAVVGESGSGKSTLARTITGLLQPNKGTVTFENKRLPQHFQHRTRDVLRRIQMIYQSADTALNPRHTVRKLIDRPLEMYAGLRGAALRQRAAELLAMVELDEKHLERLPSELSGGEKQRVAIARAIAAKPDLIICDEITSALDQIVQRDILLLLQRLQRELGITYLFITHDLAVVRAIADDIVVMHRGRVVENGSKETVLAPPHEPYTELLLSSVPQMNADWLTGFLKKRHELNGLTPPDGPTCRPPG